MDKFSLEPHHEPTAPLTNQDAEALGSQADPICINCAAASSELSCASCFRASQYEQTPSRGRTSTLQSSGQYWFYTVFEDGGSTNKKVSREQTELAANTASKCCFLIRLHFLWFCNYDQRSPASTFCDPALDFHGYRHVADQHWRCEPLARASKLQLTRQRLPSPSLVHGLEHAAEPWQRDGVIKHPRACAVGTGSARKR